MRTSLPCSARALASSVGMSLPCRISCGIGELPGFEVLERCLRRQLGERDDGQARKEGFDETANAEAQARGRHERRRRALGAQALHEGGEPAERSEEPTSE